jgi:8-oxo-dGTP diphosphatase
MEECACAIFVRNGRILLGRRSPHLLSCPNCWDVIGGHVEEGETVEHALVREAEEEVGLTPTCFVPAGRMDRGAVYHFYFVLDWRGGEPSLRGDEHTELRWFTRVEASALDPLALPEYPTFFRDLQIPD